MSYGGMPNHDLVVITSLCALMVESPVRKEKFVFPADGKAYVKAVAADGVCVPTMSVNSIGYVSEKNTEVGAST